MYYFVVNPASRSGKGIEVWNTVEGYLKKTGTEYEALFSEAQGQIESIVRDLTSAHAQDELPINMIILGGDGTLDEALQGVFDFTKVNIGYIPTGSSNDFARALKMGDDVIEITKKVLGCIEPSIIDLGRLEYLSASSVRSRFKTGEIKNTRYFDVSCGIGFDAAICEEALDPGGSKSFLNKIGLGKLIYLKIALHIIFKGAQPDGKLILSNGETVRFNKLRFLVGMNTCYEGGGFKFAPDAVCNDGYLDLCLVSDLSAAQAFLVLPRALKGKHTASRKVKTYHEKSFEIVTDEPLWVHTDGEVYTKSSHIKVSIEPGLLRLLYPV